jgi:iron complex transport system ATP-binding protein
VPETTDHAALCLRGVRLVHEGRAVLDEIDWTVRAHERWVVLGRNGCGKTSLIRIASLYLHPSAGTVDVLGERLGRTDVRSIRTRIGLASSSLTDQLRPTLTAHDVVVTARFGALEPWWHRYDEADHRRADAQLERLGVRWLTDRELGTLSSGERQRVLVARTLMNDPGLVLLDEPTAGLDLGGREELVGALAALAADPTSPPTVLVTHHVDEIPPGFTHVLLLKEGRVLAAGPLATTLTAEALTACFDLDLALERRGGRYSAWAR